jgi:hypothetical protein
VAVVGAEDEVVVAVPRVAAAVPPGVVELHAVVVHRGVSLHAHLPCRGPRRPPSDVQVQAVVPA